MSTSVWGPPIWIFFHSLAEKLKDESFSEIGSQIFYFIRRICSSLPCPECTQHAVFFLSKINFSLIKSKEAFKLMLCLFHNIVNQRKKLPLFPPQKLTETYSRVNILEAFNGFVRVYHTKGNMKMLADALPRKMVIMDLRKWLGANLRHFTPPIPLYPLLENPLLEKVEQNLESN
jgi:hypothetical protein